jgi:hypothetical protein
MIEIKKLLKGKRIGHVLSGERDKCKGASFLYFIFFNDAIRFLVLNVFTRVFPMFLFLFILLGLFDYFNMSSDA